MKNILVLLATAFILSACHEGAANSPYKEIREANNMPYYKPSAVVSMENSQGRPMGPAMGGAYVPYEMKGSFQCTFVPSEPKYRSTAIPQEPIDNPNPVVSPSENTKEVVKNSAVVKNKK